MDLFQLYAPQIINLTILSIISLISPGPDFAIIVRNSLIYSRKTALFTALGIALGVTVHITYAILGFAFVVDKIQILFLILKYLGASYLLYIGYQGLRAKKHQINFGDVSHHHDLTPRKALSSGFLVNVTNPKAALFFLSVFSVLVTPETPGVILFTYGLIDCLLTLVWFTIVILFLSGKRTREKFSQYRHLIERITGALLIAIGIKLLIQDA